MTENKLEKKIEKLINYKVLDNESSKKSYRIKHSTSNRSSLLQTPNSERQISIQKPSKQPFNFISSIPYPKNDNLANPSKIINISDLPIINPDNNKSLISNTSDKRKFKINSFSNSAIETNQTDEIPSITQTQNNQMSNLKRMNNNKTNLIQFKSFSHELNNGNKDKGDLEIKHHKKKPQFSIDFDNINNGSSKLSAINIQKEKPLFSNHKSTNTTIIHSQRLSVITESNLLNKPKFKKPGQEINGFRTNSLNNNQKIILKPINAKNYKLSLKKNPVTDIKTFLQKKEINEVNKESPLNHEAEKQTEGDTPKTIFEKEPDKRNFSLFMKKRIHSNATILKSKEFIKNLIKIGTTPLKTITNPYEPTKNTVKTYYHELTYKYLEEDDNITEIVLSKKYFTYPFPEKFFYYEYGFPEGHYILNKYFDCYNELMSDFIGDNETNNKNKFSFSLNNYDLKRRLSCMQIMKKKDVFDNSSDFTLKNQDFIFKFILLSNSNWFSQPVSFKSKENNDSNKKKPIMKRTSMGIRLSFAFQEKRKVSQVFKFKRAKTKLEDYNIFTHKQNLAVITEEYLHSKQNTNQNNLIKRDKRKKMTLTFNEISPENLWKIMYNDVFYNKTKHFREIYTKNLKKIEINRQDEKGNTLLIYGTINNSRDIIEFLLQKGCDPNLQNNYGNTALHYAISHKFFNLSNLLIKYNAMENIRNSLGYTPWECLNKDCESAF